MTLQFHVVTFEGPDPYAHAGGIATRVSGLCGALSELGYETHLWFIGDPSLPGHEVRGNLHLHRWCQWISKFHPHGVYDGQEGKRKDFTESLPPWMLVNVVLPHVHQGGRAVVLAEEWQTADAVLRLDAQLRAARARRKVAIFWNANNVFGFENIDWPALAQASVITTVSRYMKQRMQPLGVDPLAIPNGLSKDAFEPVHQDAAKKLKDLFRGRLVVTKIARFDPDKRWILAVETMAEMKQEGLRPLFVARGGVEAHGGDVIRTAKEIGLKVAERALPEPGVKGLIRVCESLDGADLVSLRSHLDWESRRLLFAESAAVLVNSGHEPFGLVGLEAMAVGGLACTGCTGEDYAVSGYNSLVLQTADPREFVELYSELRDNPELEKALREGGRATARNYAWGDIVRRSLVPRVNMSLHALQSLRS